MAAWTPAEDRQLRQLWPEFRARHIAAAFGRSLSSIKNRAKTLKLRKNSNAGRFKAGECRYRTPKGTRNSPRTEFKKGIQPHNTVPIGSETTDRDGYLKRKVSDDRSKPIRFNWRYVHRLLWEQHHGPIPRGHSVVFRDGDKTHIVITNLELVTDQELMRRNTVRRYSPDLALAMQLLGRVRKRIKRAEEQAA